MAGSNQRGVAYDPNDAQEQLLKKQIFILHVVAESIKEELHMIQMMLQEQQKTNIHDTRTGNGIKTKRYTYDPSIAKTTIKN